MSNQDKIRHVCSFCKIRLMQVRLMLYVISVKEFCWVPGSILTQNLLIFHYSDYVSVVLNIGWLMEIRASFIVLQKYSM